MLRAARAEVRALLADLPARRPPALRRALTEDAMLACDLPLASDPATAAVFCDRARGRGWRVTEDRGWLLLDKPDLIPPPIGDELPEGEAGCVLSLLRRHPELWRDLTGRRMLAKASECAAPKRERVCAELHARWALRLAGPLGND